MKSATLFCRSLLAAKILTKGFVFCIVVISAQQRRINVGDRVRVKPSVNNPKQGWGRVTHQSVGVVKSKTFDWHISEAVLQTYCIHIVWHAPTCAILTLYCFFFFKKGLAEDEITVDFPEHFDWMGGVAEIEIAP